MFFKNAQVYRLADDFTVTADQLREALAQHPVTELTSEQISSFGWESPYGLDSDELVLETAESAGGHMLIQGRYSYRDLPSAVIKDALAKKVHEIESTTGRCVGRRERAELKDSLIFDLMRHAFIKHRVTRAAFVGQYLIVDAASSAQAEGLLTELRHALGSLPVTLPRFNSDFRLTATTWLSDTPPAGLRIGSEVVLEGIDHQTVRFLNCDLDKAKPHIEEGMFVDRIGLRYDELSFVLDDKLALRKLRFSDVLKSSVAEQAGDDSDTRVEVEATFMITSALLMDTISHVMYCLGGEVQA